MFILNTTFGVKVAWKIIQTFLRESTTKKISLTDKAVDPDLFEFAHKSQIEAKYGGDAEGKHFFSANFNYFK